MSIISGVLIILLCAVVTPFTIAVCWILKKKSKSLNAGSHIYDEVSLPDVLHEQPSINKSQLHQHNELLEVVVKVSPNECYGSQQARPSMTNIMIMTANPVYQ